MIDCLNCTESPASQSIGKDQEEEEKENEGNPSATPTWSLRIELNKPVSVTKDSPTLFYDLQSLQIYPVFSPEASTAFINVEFLFFTIPC